MGLFFLPEAVPASAASITEVLTNEQGTLKALIMPKKSTNLS